VEHRLFMQKILFGLKLLKLWRLVFGCTVQTNILNPLEDCIPGKYLYEWFNKRHPQLSRKASDQTCAARAGKFVTIHQVGCSFGKAYKGPATPCNI